MGLTSTDRVDDTEGDNQVPWLRASQLSDLSNGRGVSSELLTSVTKALPKKPAVPAANPRVRKKFRRCGNA